MPNEQEQEATPIEGDGASPAPAGQAGDPAPTVEDADGEGGDDSTSESEEETGDSTDPTVVETSGQSTAPDPSGTPSGSGSGSGSGPSNYPASGASGSATAISNTAHSGITAANSQVTAQSGAGSGASAITAYSGIGSGTSGSGSGSGSGKPPFPGPGWYCNGVGCTAIYISDADQYALQSSDIQGPFGSSCEAMNACFQGYPGNGWYCTENGAGEIQGVVEVTSQAQFVELVCGCGGGPAYGMAGPYSSQADAEYACLGNPPSGQSGTSGSGSGSGLSGHSGTSGTPTGIDSGVSGTSGTSGVPSGVPSGTSGNPSGTSGEPSGQSGNSGYPSGQSGLSGHSGFSGPSGVLSGHSGGSGVYSGISGVGSPVSGTSGASGGPCCPEGYIWNPYLEACVPGTPVVLCPDKPAPPRLVSKSNAQIKIQSPIWADDDPQKPIKRMEWEREELGLGGDHIGGIWNSQDDQSIDIQVERFKTYHYRCRAINDVCTSEWSDYLTVALVSSTCVVVLTEPLDGAQLKGEIPLVMHVTDSGAGASLEHFEASGFPLPDAFLLPGGTHKNGTWRLFFETREWLQGAVLIRALALGSDGLWAFDEATVQLVNTPQNNIKFCDVGPLSSTRANKVFRRVHIGIETPALSVKPRFQWFALPYLRAWDFGAADPFPNPPADETEAGTQLKKHQRVSFGRGKILAAQPPRPERRSYYEVPTLTTAAPAGAGNVMLRLQLFEREFFLGWKLAPSTKLVKAREWDQAMFIWGISTASAWKFQDGAATLVFDLASVGLGGGNGWHVRR